MEAFHSFWSAPGLLRSGGILDFPDFELLTAMLSALKWKEKNGSVRMITDTPGAMFFREQGMEELWDEIDLSLDQMNIDINPILFWAAGKLHALQQMNTPCVMLDTDLIIWEKIEGLSAFDLVAAHPEGLNPFVYPDHSIFQFRENYRFPSDWDFTQDAANTAFLYIKNEAFRDAYVQAAMDFFFHVNLEGLNPVTAMCFAEQRILPMMAKAHDQSIAYLLDLSGALQQSIATHTWGYKNILRQNAGEREAFCRKCVKRIQQDFPEWEKKIAENPILSQYI